MGRGNSQDVKAGIAMDVRVIVRDAGKYPDYFPTSTSGFKGMDAPNAAKPTPGVGWSAAGMMVREFIRIFEAEDGNPLWIQTILDPVRGESIGVMLDVAADPEWMEDVMLSIYWKSQRMVADNMRTKEMKEASSVIVGMKRQRSRPP